MSISNTSQLKVGIVIKQFGTDYFGKMIDGAVEALRKACIDPVVIAGGVSAEEEQHAIDSLLNKQCDGLILQSDYLDDNALHEVCERHSNTVLMNRYLPEFKENCVFVDNYSAARKAAKYLIENGHSSIAMVSGPYNLKDSQERYRGFHDELSSYGITINPKLLIESTFGEGGGKRAIKMLLDSQIDFTAVYFHNDIMAVGAMSYCSSVNIRIPEDLSVIGFDDQDLARKVTPGLTTVRQPLVQIGERSGQLLVELLTNSVKRTSNEFKLDLIERDSACSLISSDNPEAKKVKLTAREIECLNWTSKGKTASEVAVILGISHSTVEFHLRKAGKKLNTVNRVHLVAKAIAESHLMAH